MYSLGSLPKAKYIITMQDGYSKSSKTCRREHLDVEQVHQSLESSNPKPGVKQQFKLIIVMFDIMHKAAINVDIVQ